MTELTAVSFVATELEGLAEWPGRIAILVDQDGALDEAALHLDAVMGGAISRVAASDGFANGKPGDVTSLAFPSGLAAIGLDIVCVKNDADKLVARKAGAKIAKTRGGSELLLLTGALTEAAEMVFGLVMRDYGFEDHKTAEPTVRRAVVVMSDEHIEVTNKVKPLLAIAEGAFMTRDLTNEPANVLTTTEFAKRLVDMSDLGLKVEVLDEDQLASLGMRTLLCVGQGSTSPSHVVVMRWNGGGDEAPLALVGKGVVFDTGGISLKPGAGMEDMTMDMGGAAVVSGVMRSLALRGAKANVVGLVGIVENMPAGNAVRPGDVIRSMKGDTVEVINTDAEGRLVLCDVMWYAQERFKPAAMIDLATLTGAIVVGLGHENAGVFSNDDALCDAFLSAAQTEGEGAWRMPLGQAYDDLLKSRIADMKNIGGRAAGSVTAAQFLQRFVKDDCPWIHLDIAGVASVKSETALAPTGATGWGVSALNRLISNNFEQG